MNIGSLFAGLGGIDLAFEQAGFTPAWQVEIDPAATKILQRHWPEVPKYGDITHVDPADLSPVDVICGGSPCQSFSVAGQRAGLDGASGLFWHFIRIADSQPHAMVCWENVPGVLSSDHGYDFALILWAFTGYYPGIPTGGWRNSGVCVGRKRSIAWRILDAQYAGVPQRRRRVFLVGDSRTGVGPLEILFEPESLSGDSPTRQKPGQVAPSLLASGAGTSRPAGIGSEADFLIPEVAGTLGGGSGHRGYPNSPDVTTFIPEIAATRSVGSAQTPGVNVPGRRREDDTNVIVIQDVRGSTRERTNRGQGMGIKASETMYTLDATSQHAIGIFMAGQGSKARSVAYSEQSSPTLKAVQGGNAIPVVCLPEVAHTLRGEGFDGSEDGTGRGTPLAVATLTAKPYADNGTQESRLVVANEVSNADQKTGSSFAVRRLLPLECERLMGLPEGWTRWDADGNELSDSARYRMVGNSVAVPVVRWIAERMAIVMQGGLP